MNPLLPYDPGTLPSKPAPSEGESFQIEISGLPPIKDRRQSIRNRQHPLHERFMSLRRAATEAMAGRAWAFGPVELDLTVRSPNRDLEHGLNDYLGGIMDTLDGSSGFTFTFLPIVFEDDSQVCNIKTQWESALKCSYILRITFR